MNEIWEENTGKWCKNLFTHKKEIRIKQRIDSCETYTDLNHIFHTSLEGSHHFQK